MSSRALRTERIAGAIFLALLGGAIAAVLLLSGRSVGPGVRFDVAFDTTGPLASDAKLRLAGNEIGEVRGIRSAGSGQRGVLVACFVARRWAGDVRQNSDVFIATPSVLGEAYLEIGPPRGGAEPGPPIAEGARLRGADPPSLDALMAHLYKNVTEILGLLREQRPELDALLESTDGLLATLAGVPVERGQLGRIRDQALGAAAEAGALIDGLRRAAPREQLARIAGDLSETADRVGPELAAIAGKAEQAEANVRALRGLVGDEERAKLEHALAGFRRAAETAEAVLGDAQALAAWVARGHGTLGGFGADKELFEDLHETHRLIKWNSWKLVVPPRPKD